MYIVYVRYCSWSATTHEYFVETEAEAQRLVKGLEKYFKNYEIGYYFRDYDHVDAVLANLEAKRLKKIDERKNSLAKDISEGKEVLAVLKRAKKFLDKYLIGVDDFIPLIPTMYEAVMETDLPISFYDDHKEYSHDGVEESYEERLDYSPITIDINSPIAGFYYYKNGAYNIDDDIKSLKNYIARCKRELTTGKIKID